MLMFIIYVLVLYIASIGCGSFIKKESKLYSLRSVIGFASFLGVSQIIYYPMLYFKVSSIVTNTTTAILLLGAFILGLFKVKKEDFKFLKSYEFWIILIAVFIVIKIMPGFDAGDDSFYMSLFKDNSNIDSINTINPRVGLVGYIDYVYVYQGFYLLMSFIYGVQNFLFSGDINNIFISFRTTMSVLAIIFTSLIFIYIKDNYKDKNNKKVFYLIQLLSFFLVAVLEWAHIYWGSFMIFQIFIPLIMILFNLYLKDKDKYKYILTIVNLGILSLASSSLFLFAIVAFGYFTYEMFNKSVKSKDYFLMLLPSIIYACFIFNKLIFIPIALIIYLIYSKIDKVIDNLLNKYLKYVLFILPIVFLLIGLHMNYTFSLETYRVSKITHLYNFIVVFYSIYLIIKKEKINPNIFAFMVIVLLFFNPVVEPFVSHYMTSTYVYYRLFYITRNPFIVTVVILSIYDTCKKHNLKKILIPLFIGGVSLLIINYGKNFLESTVLLENYNTPYNYLLREDEYSIELGKEIQKLPSNSKILSMYFAPRMYKDDLITDVIRYPDKKEYYWNYAARLLYREDESLDTTYYYFSEYIKENNYQYLILFNNDKIKKLERFSGRYDIMFKNDKYVLVNIKEELWEN